MFEFGTLITILITIILGYITLYFTFRHQLDEIESNNSKDKKYKYHIRKRIKFINFFFPILTIIIIILYFLPDIKLIYIQIDFKFITKIFPFKEGFFDNKNFKFSYITGLIISIIVILFFIVFTVTCWWGEIENKIIALITIIFLNILTAYCLIWVNYYISTFLDYCIVHYFELLSIAINILSYGVILLLLFSIVVFVYDEIL